MIRRRPVRAQFCGEEFLSNPPPSAGGVLIAYGLPLLESLGPGEPGKAEAIDHLARVMREQANARMDGFDRALRRGGLARALEERAAIARGTTHISVVDGAGNAVSLTSSTGAGSGVVIPGTGIHLNNMIGEFDVTRMPPAGARLSSMMSPSLVLRDGRPHLVVGSAGSLRLRGAVLQIVVNAVAHDLHVEDAIDRPRVHLEGDDLHCEGGHDEAELDKLEALGWNVTRWRSRNLFFGGASAVTSADGRLAAAGRSAPRRRGGGGGVIVRPAHPADAEGLAKLGQAVGSEPEGWLVSTNGWRDASDERRYLRAIRRYPNAAVYVAEEDGLIVGRLSIARDQHPASRHVADLGLMVAAAHRRRGVGTALLEAAVEWARQAGVRKLELHVFPWNKAAIALYDRFGFVREGYRRGHYRRGDEYVDAILMAYDV